MNPGPSSASLAFGVLNTRSVVNKASLLHSLISDNDLDILALTETWVGADDPPVIKSDPAPSGYRITHVHRDNPNKLGAVVLPSFTETQLLYNPENTN